METRRKRFLKGAAAEQMPKVIIKNEVEFLAEGSHVPDLSNQELELVMKSMRSIKTEEDPYNNDGGPHAVQQFTPFPQTDEFIKAELNLDEEFKDNMSGSEENCKQLVQLLADRKQEFHCDLCERTFSVKCNLERHKLRKHSDKPETNQKSVACEVCHRTYLTEYIRAHMRLAHAKPKFECKFCPRLFNRRRDLETHLNNHAAVRKRGFACDLCEKKFYKQGSLFNHKKMHTQENKLAPSNDAGVPIKTELISDEEEEFIDERSDRDSVSHAEKSQEPAVATVEQRISVGIAEDSVTCEVCNNSYPGELIERHMRIAHGDVTYKSRVHLQKSSSVKYIGTQDNRARPYACVQCESRFLEKSALSRHMNTQHNKNRKPKYNCELCEKKFHTYSGFRYHMNAHNGVTVGCDVCGERFTQVQSLREHMLRKHTAKTQTVASEGS